MTSNNHPGFLPKSIIEKALNDITQSNGKTGYNLSMYFDMLNYMLDNYDDEKIFYKYREEKALKRLKNTIMNIDKVRKQSYKVGLEPLTKEWMDSLDG